MSEFIIYKQERNKVKGLQLRILRGKINPADVLLLGEGRGCHHQPEEGQGTPSPASTSTQVG